MSKKATTGALKPTLGRPSLDEKVHRIDLQGSVKTCGWQIKNKTNSEFGEFLLRTLYTKRAQCVVVGNVSSEKEHGSAPPLHPSVVTSQLIESDLSQLQPLFSATRLE